MIKKLNGFDLALMAFLVRIPGIAWGFHLVSGAPFTYFSWDEWSVANALTGWLAHMKSFRKDYVAGFVREMSFALPIARLMGDATAPLKILFSARLLNVFFGAATVWVVYRLARLLQTELYPALVAGAFLALAPIHVANSHYATPTASLAFWVYLAFFSFLSYRASPRPSFWLLGCGAAGIAIAVKFGFICVIPLAYLLIRTEKKYVVKLLGLIVFAGAFYYFNFGDLPWKRLAPIKDVLVSDNFYERVHPRWFNPVMFAIDLIPSLGLPTFICMVAGAFTFWRKPASELPEPVSRTDRFFCLELPLMIYFVAICSMTSIFLRHLVLPAPFLCIVAANGLCRVEANLTSKNREKAARVLVLAIGLYQVVSVGWLAKQHLTDRVWLGLEWLGKNVPSGKKVYIAERTQFDVPWKEDLPTFPVTPSFGEADYFLVTENIVWRFRRSLLNPLTSSPKKEEVYHYRYMKDPEFLREFVNGHTPFKRVAYFPAYEILPEFMLYKKIFNTFNFEYGDVSVFERTAS